MLQPASFIESGMNHPKEEAVQQQACLLLIFLVRKLIIAAFFCAITFIIMRFTLPPHFTLFICCFVLFIFLIMHIIDFLLRFNHGVILIIGHKVAGNMSIHMLVCAIYMDRLNTRCLNIASERLLHDINRYKRFV